MQCYVCWRAVCQIHSMTHSVPCSIQFQLDKPCVLRICISTAVPTWRVSCRTSLALLPCQDCLGNRALRDALSRPSCPCALLTCLPISVPFARIRHPAWSVLRGTARHCTRARAHVGCSACARDRKAAAPAAPVHGTPGARQGGDSAAGSA